MANINGGTPGSNIGKASALINRKKLTPALPNNPKFAPNVWGIYDMHGNVKEWCYDFYGEYPKGETLLDPIGPIRGVKRVIRGGSFLRAAQSARSACRESLEPSWRGSEIGFRIVLGYPLR
jgi:formylglycine-generating enzyme required for sulfatase activity